jgi:hypothetical protein
MPRKRKNPPADTPAATADTPEQIRRGFRAVALATGAPVPAPVPALPTVDTRAQISAMAATVGMILHPTPLFRHALGLVTVDETTGALELMSAERFCSWCERHLAFVKWTDDGARPESIGKNLAGLLLASDQLRGHLRELKAVHPVRMPAWRGEGEARTVELAAPGYDPESGVFTLDSVPYSDDMPAEDALRFLLDSLRYFGWEAEGETNFAKRRSFAAFLAAALGVYCHGLFREGTARPFVILNGNQPGTGKSLLARVALCPVHGWIPESGKPESESELEKLLDSAAMARKAFLLLDDVEDLKSPAMNRFLTSPVHECRRMHSQTLAVVFKTTQLFCTGNGLNVTPDLERRGLLVDLFEAGEATSRTFPQGKELTSEALAMAATRARWLAAWWALVRNWRDCGMPSGVGRKPSFERWAAVIGGILSPMGSLADPFGKRVVVAGGDESGRALRRLLAIYAGTHEPEDAPRPTTADLLELAEAENLIELIELSKDQRKSLGGKLVALKGRQLIDTRGRLFEFGRRDIATGACYPIRYLTEVP